MVFVSSVLTTQSFPLPPSPMSMSSVTTSSSSSSAEGDAVVIFVKGDRITPVPTDT